MIRRPPRSTLFPYTTALPILLVVGDAQAVGLVAFDAEGLLVQHADLVDRRSEEHTSELQSRRDLVCRLLLEKKKKKLCIRRSIRPLVTSPVVLRISFVCVFTL